MREPVQNQDLLPTGYESIADALSRMDDGLEVPEDFHARWRYAVEKEAWQLKEKKHRNRRIGRLQWRVLAAAAAVVFLFGGTLLSRDAIHNAVNGAIVPSETAVTQDAIVAESYMAGMRGRMAAQTAAALLQRLRQKKVPAPSRPLFCVLHPLRSTPHSMKKICAPLRQHWKNMAVGRSPHMFLAKNRINTAAAMAATQA